MSEFMHTDLPEPVVPAMSMCGSLAILPMMQLPPMSLPTANESLDLALRNAGESIISRRHTALTILFGTSMPTVEILSGIGAMRTFFHAECERKVTGKVRDLVELHTRLELEVVARDRRTARHVADGSIDAEAAQGGVEPVTVEADLLRRVRLVLLPRAQERHRRELIGRVVGILALDGGGDGGRLPLRRRRWPPFLDGFGGS